MNSKINENIESDNTIYLDIFSTLFEFKYSNRLDFFRHLEESLEIKGFADARNEVQMKLDSDTINIDNVYSELSESYNFTKEHEMNHFKNAFLLKTSEFNRSQSSYRDGKTVVFFAYSLYPRELIEALLENYKILYSELIVYTSENEYAKKCIECGLPQNFMYDEINRYEKKIRLSESKNANYYSILNRYTDYSVVSNLIKKMATNKEVLSTEGYWYHFGYAKLGIVVDSFYNWLLHEVKSEKITKCFILKDELKLITNSTPITEFPVELIQIQGIKERLYFANITERSDIKKELLLDSLIGLSYEEYFYLISEDNTKLIEDFEKHYGSAQMQISAKAVDMLINFLIKHEDYLIENAAQKRAFIINQFGANGNELIGLIGMGWDAKIQSGIERVFKKENMKINFCGLYFTTTSKCSKNIFSKSYLIEKGKKSNIINGKYLAENLYINSLLNYFFNGQNTDRIQSDDVLSTIILDDVERGVLDFIFDFQQLQGDYRLITKKEIAIAPIEYFATNPTKKDLLMLKQCNISYGFGGSKQHIVLRKTGKPTFAIINPWPGAMSAEFEVVERVKRAATEAHLECICLDNFGHILDSQQNATKEYIDPNTVDFAITSHYDSHKTVDAFHYHTLWNPPEIPLNLPDYATRVTNNYVMNDDFLIYDFGGMSNHLKSMLLSSPRNLENASTLVASFPESAMLKCNLNNPKLFYCGMNWERVVHNSNRHEGLFKMLDNTGKVKFFGPDKNPAWGGIAPWEGYKSYQYPIPFDGFSILQEINECGIVLVLSSDIHRRAGAATNRTYEACAGGAVIISDNNAFMEHYFKDAALFINYNKNNPKDTFDQIMEKYEWIKTHPEESKKLVQRAQEIFKEKFTLDQQLKSVFDNHYERFRTVEQNLFAMEEEENVLATGVVNTLKIKDAKEYLDAIFKNVNNQYYDNIRVGIACDLSLYETLNEYAQEMSTKINLIPVALFDEKKARVLTDAQVINQIHNQHEFEYCIHLSGIETWFFDHVTTLVRVLQNDSQLGYAYSGSTSEDIDGYRRTEMFKNIDMNELMDIKGIPCSSQVMFTREFVSKLPEFLFDCIDGTEIYLYILMANFNYEIKGKFTKRMTLIYDTHSEERKNYVISLVYQMRFINDLIKDYLPDSILNVEKIKNLSVGEAGYVFPKQQLVMFPIKLWFVIRWYSVRMRMSNVTGDRYKKLAQKRDAAIKKLEDKWGLICIS